MIGYLFKMGIPIKGYIGSILGISISISIYLSIYLSISLSLYIYIDILRDIDMQHLDIYMWISCSRCGYLIMGMDIRNASKSRKIFIGKYLHNTTDMCGYINTRQVHIQL